MLVLLIIFMVTAPLLTAGVPLDLPKTGAGQLNVDQRPITVSINERGQIFVGETQSSVAELAARIQPLAKQASTSASMCAARSRWITAPWRRS